MRARLATLATIFARDGAQLLPLKFTVLIARKCGDADEANRHIRLGEPFPAVLFQRLLVNPPAIDEKCPPSSTASSFGIAKAPALDCARAEFRYVDLGTTSISCAAGDSIYCPGYRGEFSNTLMMGLVGLNYKF